MDTVRRTFIALLLVSSSLFAVESKDVFISKLFAIILNVKSSFTNEVAVRIPNSLIIGMASLESGYGTSSMARNKNNYFGMKSGNSYTKFHNLSDSVKVYLQNLSTNNAYKKFQLAILNGEENPHKLLALIALKYSGNEGDYAKKVKNIIASNSLIRFDDSALFASKADSKYLKDVIGKTKLRNGVVLYITDIDANTSVVEIIKTPA
ncbi:MAG: Bax protein [Patescibacteria group bacterium]|nr:Bax protein [Patescibacteria group bacterium]